MYENFYEIIMWSLILIALSCMANATLNFLSFRLKKEKVDSDLWKKRHEDLFFEKSALITSYDKKLQIFSDELNRVRQDARKQINALKCQLGDK